jgi:hypothetical protein
MPSAVFLKLIRGPLVVCGSLPGGLRRSPDGFGRKSIAKIVADTE